MLEQSFSTPTPVRTQQDVCCSKTWKRAFSSVCAIHYLSRGKYNGTIKPVVFWVWSASKQTAKLDGQSSHHREKDQICFLSMFLYLQMLIRLSFYCTLFSAHRPQLVTKCPVSRAAGRAENCPSVFLMEPNSPKVLCWFWWNVRNIFVEGIGWIAFLFMYF